VPHSHTASIYSYLWESDAKSGEMRLFALGILTISADNLVEAGIIDGREYVRKP
jgi:hypothetical protein